MHDWQPGDRPPERGDQGGDQRPNRQDTPPTPSIWMSWSRLRLFIWGVACLTANAAVQTAVFSLTESLFGAVAAGGLLGILLPCALLAHTAGISLAKDFALGRPPFGQLFWSAIAAAASLVPTSMLANLSARVHPMPAEWEELYAAQMPHTPAAILLAYVAASVVAPLAEELLFRGILQRLATRLWGSVPALLLTALAFALLHREPWHFFGLAGVGLLFGYVWSATRSVTACAVAHAVHNSAALTIMLRTGSMGSAAGNFDTHAMPWLAASLALLALSLSMLGRSSRRETSSQPSQR